MLMKLKPTREDYRLSILHDLQRLIAQVETGVLDERYIDSATRIAQGLPHDVKAFFDEDRWRSTPIFDGLRERVPLGQPLTILLTQPTWRAGSDEPQWIQAEVQELHSPKYGQDGAYLRVLKRRRQNVSHLTYQDGPGAALSIYRGFKTPEECLLSVPIFGHAHWPEINLEPLPIRPLVLCPPQEAV